jgi:hypothetical protein
MAARKWVPYSAHWKGKDIVSTSGEKPELCVVSFFNDTGAGRGCVPFEDSVKRCVFTGIQNSHTVPCDTYSPLPLSTGYEDVIAHRTDALYATTAKQPGVVTAVTSTGIVVTNGGGSTVAVELGKRFGKTKGSVLPHNVITDLAVGDKVTVGQPIAWNTNFFVKSKLSKVLRYKAGIIARTVLIDGADTFEDSSAISKEFANRMASKITYTRYLVLNFDQHINGLVSEGQVVKADSILCTIQDSVTAGAGLFDDDTLSTLQSLADATPKAKHEGVIDRLDVIYNGNIADMDESLQSVASLSDRRRTRTAGVLGKPRLTGQVDGTYRIEGNPLQPNQLAIVVYITANIGMGVGDKLVFGNQLKSIIGRVMVGTNRTVSGENIDALFSYSSVCNRLVISPEIMGTTNTLLGIISNKAAAIYKNSQA